MRKRMLTKQIASLGLSIAMVMGSLSNVPVTALAQNATETVVADDVTSSTNTTKVIDETTLNSEIYDNPELYPAGGLEEGDVVFEDAIKVKNVEEYYQLINGNSATMTTDATSSSVVYPSAADNSTNENAKYLPDVQSQGSSGSCVSYAYVYSLGTYTLNKARNKSSKIESNVLSPWFSHNIIRAGSDWSRGSWARYANQLMTEIGAPSLEQVPYDTSVRNYGYTWYPTEEIWTSAADNRVENVVGIDVVGTDSTQITSAEDSDLDVIKATLSSGKIIAFSTRFYTLNYTTIPSNSPSHAGEHAIDRCDYVRLNSDGTRNYGGHAMTIVGYDDNIWIRY